MKSKNWFVLLGLLLFGLLGCATTATDHAGHDHGMAAKGEPERITIDQVLARMQQGQPIVFLDSRNTTAWSEGSIKIPEAIRVGNNEQLAAVMQELPKDSFIVTYCT